MKHWREGYPDIVQSTWGKQASTRSTHLAHTKVLSGKVKVVHGSSSLFRRALRFKLNEPVPAMLTRIGGVGTPAKDAQHGRNMRVGVENDRCAQWRSFDGDDESDDTCTT